MAKRTFQDLAELHKLDQDTVKKLREEKSDDCEVLKWYTEDNVKSLKLPTGEQIRLNKLIEQLNEVELDSPIQHTSPKLVSEALSDVKCVPSQDVTLTVRFTGCPDVCWYLKRQEEVKRVRDGVVKTSRANGVLVRCKIQLSKRVVQGDEYEYELCMKNVSRVQDGEYIVTAKNKLGEAECKVTVNVSEPSAVLVNSEGDERYFDDDVRTVEDVLKKCTNLRTSKSYEQPDEFLTKNLLGCDIAIVKVTGNIRHLEGVIALIEQWKKEGKQLRKIIPVYSSQQQYDRLTHLPVFLRTDPLIMRQNEDDNNLDAFKESLFKKLSDLPSQKMDSLYPMGDVCKGLAINYITLLNRMLCPEMDEEYKVKCKELEDTVVDGCTKQRVDKTIIAVPTNCKCQYKLAAYGDEFAKPITLRLSKDKMHGLERDFTMSMYEIRKEDKIYMPRVEVPNIVTTLSKVTEKEGEPAEHARNFEGVARLSPKQMREQREGFVNEITQLIDFYHKDEYLIVPFDESKQDLAENVIAKIEEDLAQPRKDKETEKAPCAVVMGGAEEQDEDIEKAFVQELVNRQINVLRHEHPSDSEIQPRGTGVNFNNATLFLLIRNGKLTEQQCQAKYSYLRCQDNHKYRQLVPVIVDDAQRVDDPYLQGVVARKYRAPGQSGHDKFMQDACTLCTSKKPLTYPMGEVYKGLVWTAALNYFLPVMPGKVASMRQKVAEVLKSKHPGAKFFSKQIHLVEDHCRDSEGKMFADYEGIEMVDFTKYDVDNVAAGVTKAVNFTIYLITYNGQEYLACFEYVRAVTCLGEIHGADLIPLAMPQMEEQVDSFVCLYKDKVEGNIEKIRDTCALLRYDGDNEENRKDKELHLSKIIAEFIEANSDDVITL